MTSRGELLISQHCAMCHAIGRSETSPNAMARPFEPLAVLILLIYWKSHYAMVHCSGIRSASNVDVHMRNGLNVHNGRVTCAVR